MTPDEAIDSLQKERELEAAMRAMSDELFATPRPDDARVWELRERLGAYTAEVWRIRRARRTAG